MQNMKTKKKLNWTKVLYDHDIFVESEAYRKWEGNMQFEGRQLLEKDLSRTRCNQPYLQKPSTQQALRKLITFYCKRNNVSYQQGLLQVLIPFALLHQKDFELRKCYAYFQTFMKNYFPKVLTQRIIQDKKQLPHALLAISLSQTLLRYHYPQIYFLFIQHEIPLSMVLTQQILTIFAKNTPIQYVYKIYDYFINKKNKNVVLYMSIGLLGQHQKQLFEASEKDQLAVYSNKNLKNITNEQILEQWFSLSQKIERQTPQTFEIFSRDLGFTNKSMLSKQDFTIMMKIQQVLSQQDFIMPIYLKQIIENQNKYVIASIEGLQFRNCEYIKINKNKQYKYEIDPQKIIVIAQSQKGLTKDQKECVIEFARKIGLLYKITYLQQKVQKPNNCIIF